MIYKKHEFREHYNSAILGKKFVEYEAYYKNSFNRFWRSFDRIQRMKLPEQTQVLDIGGGIMGVLLAQTLKLNVTVGDVNRRAATDIEALGLPFLLLNLLSDDEIPECTFDLVILQEVIGHLPQPPYIVFNRLNRLLKPDGILFLTTPNGSRIRNVLYMLTGKQVLDHFRYPEGPEALGAQYEYTLPQMIWQLDRAHMPIIFAETYNCGWHGSSMSARLAHVLTKPFAMIPHLRNGLIVAAKRATS